MSLTISRLTRSCLTVYKALTHTEGTLKLTLLPPQAQCHTSSRIDATTSSTMRGTAAGHSCLYITGGRIRLVDGLSLSHSSPHLVMLQWAVWVWHCMEWVWPTSLYPHSNNRQLTLPTSHCEVRPDRSILCGVGSHSGVGVLVGVVLYCTRRLKLVAGVWFRRLRNEVVNDMPGKFQ